MACQLGHRWRAASAAMPRVRYAPGASRGLQRLRGFLRTRNPAAARRAGETILQAIRILGQQPRIGRPIEDLPEEFREWMNESGNGGPGARYRTTPDVQYWPPAWSAVAAEELRTLLDQVSNKVPHDADALDPQQVFGRSDPEGPGHE